MSKEFFVFRNWHSLHVAGIFGILLKLRREPLKTVRWIFERYFYIPNKCCKVFHVVSKISATELVVVFYDLDYKLFIRWQSGIIAPLLCRSFLTGFSVVVLSEEDDGTDMSLEFLIHVTLIALWRLYFVHKEGVWVKFFMRCIDKTNITLIKEQVKIYRGKLNDRAWSLSIEYLAPFNFNPMFYFLLFCSWGLLV